jgi:hypothetical protein
MSDSDVFTTAANLTALIGHLPDQLDRLPVKVLRSVKSNFIPNIGSVGSFGPKPTYRHCPID